MSNARTSGVLYLPLSSYAGTADSLQVAQGDIHAQGGGTLLVDADFTVQDTYSVPSDVVLKHQGGMITVAAGKTLTLNGPCDFPPVKVFGGAGSVAFEPGSVNEIYAEWWGANGIDAATDTAAIQKAITAAQAVQGVVQLLARTYLLTSATSPILNIATPMTLRGQGLNTVLQVQSGVGSTVDVLQIAPTVDIELLTLSDFRIFAQSGTPGRHAIYCPIPSSGGSISNSKFENLYLGALGGQAFVVSNPSNQDGFFVNHFEDCIFHNGVNITGAGDSLRFTGGVVTGANVGFEIDSVAGALSHAYRDINITSAGGAFRFHNVYKPTIEGCQLEQSVANTGPENALIAILGSSAHRAMAPVMRNNNIDILNDGTSYYAAYDIYLDYVDQASIEENRLGLGATAHIFTTANAKNTRVGPNDFDQINLSQVYSEIAPVITDNGIGTMGVAKTLTLLNSWVDYGPANYGVPSFTKGTDGWVQLSGVMKDGTTTANTVLCTLPVGFRPALNDYFATANSGAGAALGEIQVDAATGNVTIVAGGNTYLSLSGGKFWAPPA